jgi:hypothetical protein
MSMFRIFNDMTDLAHSQKIRFFHVEHNVQTRHATAVKSSTSSFRDEIVIPSESRKSSKKGRASAASSSSASTATQVQNPSAVLPFCGNLTEAYLLKVPTVRIVMSLRDRQSNTEISITNRGISAVIRNIPCWIGSASRTSLLSLVHDNEYVVRMLNQDEKAWFKKLNADLKL